MAAALQFPPYFGENWNALDECLTDLDWLPADAYVLVILDAVLLLDQEAPEERRTFWKILNQAAQAWGRPVGGQWPRPAKAFRVLAQATLEEAGRLRSLLPAGEAGPGLDVGGRQDRTP
jgi:hypothetical protein